MVWVNRVLDTLSGSFVFIDIFFSLHTMNEVTRLSTSSPSISIDAKFESDRH